MEAFEIAAGAAGFASLSSQLLQGIKWLLSFFEDVRDMPDDLIAIKDELKALELILTRLPSPSISGTTPSMASSHPQTSGPSSFSSATQVTTVGEVSAANGLQDALGVCSYWVNKLSLPILRYEPGERKSRARRAWTQLNASLRKKRF